MYNPAISPMELIIIITAGVVFATLMLTIIDSKEFL